MCVCVCVCVNVRSLTSSVSVYLKSVEMLSEFCSCRFRVGLIIIYCIMDKLRNDTVLKQHYVTLTETHCFEKQS